MRLFESRIRILPAALAGLPLFLMIAPDRGSGEESGTPAGVTPIQQDQLLERFQKMVQANLDNPWVVESSRINAAMEHFGTLPLGDRLAAWASWFADLGTVEYRFGGAPDGYVTAGRICQDFATDCILFLYRITELARSTSAEEAVQFAFGTRFYGASIERAVREDGTVDYHDDARLDYSEDMINSGIWGQAVTDSVGFAVEEIGGVRYVPSASIDYGALRSGDIAWFVAEPAYSDTTGTPERPTAVHHVGILDRRGGEVELVHAAAKPISGIYETPGIARIPLQTYLDHVSRFRGIVVTRLVEF